MKILSKKLKNGKKRGKQHDAKVNKPEISAKQESYERP